MKNLRNTLIAGCIVSLVCMAAPVFAANQFDTLLEAVDAGYTGNGGVVTTGATQTGAFLLPGGVPQQGLTTFPTRAAYQGACAGQPFEDFELGNAPPNTIKACPQPLNSTSNNICFTPGQILPFISITTTGVHPGDGQAYVGAGFLGALSKELVANYFVERWQLNFVPLIDGWAGDLTSFLGGGNCTVQAFDAANILIGTVASPCNAGANSFVGFSSGTPIGRVEVFDTGGGAEGADNLEWGLCGPQTCGNGVDDPGEECDDGNNDNGDGCDEDCVIEFCGDGVTNDTDEQCDDGANGDDTDGCTDNCDFCPPGGGGQGPLEHFKCYAVAGGGDDDDSDDGGGGGGSGVIVDLTDQFGDETVEVGDIAYFCAPADKNGEGADTEGQHLACYSISNADGSSQPNRTIDFDNQFGLQTVETNDSALLCVPSEKLGWEESNSSEPFMMNRSNIRMGRVR